MGECGVSFPRGDVAALRTRLAELLADAALVETLAAQGPARVQREYTWDAVVDRMEASYRSVLANKRGH